MTEISSANGIDGIWLARRFVAACVIASVLLVSVTARADRGDPHSLPAFIYYSHDPALVEIFIASWLGTPKEEGRTIRLPRAMIEYANGYTRPKYPAIPDTIRTDHIGLALLFPEGMAMSIAAKQRKRQSGVDEISIINSPEFRENGNILRLRHTKLNAEHERDRGLPRTVRPGSLHANSKIGVFDGLDVYLLSNMYEFFVPKTNSDEFYSIRCPLDTERLHWCLYSFRVNEFLTATASIVSLRHFGGRAFANERIRFLRRAICRYVECKLVNDDGHFVLYGEEKG